MGRVGSSCSDPGPCEGTSSRTGRVAAAAELGASTTIPKGGREKPWKVTVGGSYWDLTGQQMPPTASRVGAEATASLGTLPTRQV